MRELKKNEWNNLMGYIAARNTVLLIGDNLTIVKNTESNVFQTLIEYISTKLYDFVVNYYTNMWEEQNYTKEKIKEPTKINDAINLVDIVKRGKELLQSANKMLQVNNIDNSPKL